MDLTVVTRKLVEALDGLGFGPPVAYVYNPLVYAAESYQCYLERYAAPPKEVLLVGMNPGPWGMAQTGVPFGDVEIVRDWLGIEAKVRQPERAHPGRPVRGFACTRREASGRRLWGWARQRFGTPAEFFDRFFVANYCPLLFFDAAGRNRTPDKLRAAERGPLMAACDAALRQTAVHLQPAYVVGIGAFAAARCEAALQGLGTGLGRIAHPSPANPAANRGWQHLAEGQLAALGVRI
jgi:single-strand selective monofunctional uracil DNA glycosylase